ncbi:MAG: hypothetical protein WCT47_20120 [Betaproteobacteria bacterium]
MGIVNVAALAVDVQVTGVVGPLLVLGAGHHKHDSALAAIGMRR